MPSPLERKVLKTRYGNLFFEVRKILNEHDPVGLIAIGCPDDEYEPELGTILPRLRHAGSSKDVQEIIDQEFDKWFGRDTLGTWHASPELAQQVWEAWQRFKTSEEPPPLKDDG